MQFDSGVYTFWTHPLDPLGHPPPVDTLSRDGHWSERYTSYWNWFLFLIFTAWKCEAFSDCLPRGITLPVVILWVTSYAQWKVQVKLSSSEVEHFITQTIASNININKYSEWSVMGWLNRLKFIGKTNQLTKMLIFTILASFVCFFNFPDRNLIILCKITWKLPFRVR